jgi:twitching motility protein PilT
MIDSESPSLHSLLEQMLLRAASDLHLKEGCPPGLRVDGHLVPVDGAAPLSRPAIEGLIGEMTTQEQRGVLSLTGDLEFAFSVAGVSRYRASLVRQRGQLGAVLRRIPVEIPDIDRLLLPPITKKLCELPRGLVLVTGPTGSGKSTTLASMVDYLNREHTGHIMTMEDPIEFVHRDRNCFVTQREIGSDCESFGTALRRALRHDPDVIMIGELRDRETISLALTAAETGHLVLATVHTPGAVQTVDRMLDAFPADDRNEARGRLAASLQGVLSQTLVPRTAGGRVAVVEVMVATEAVRSCIREGKTHQIHSQIQTGMQHGMQTCATALADLVHKSMITEEVALQHAANLDELKNQLSHGPNYLRSTARPAAPPSAPPRRAPLPGPIEPLPSPSPASPASAVPRNSGVAELLEKLRRA